MGCGVAETGTCRLVGCPQTFARVGWCSCCLLGWEAPAAVSLGSDAGAFTALRGEYCGVAGVGVAPSQVGVQPAGQHGVVRVVGVVEHKLSQRPEVRFDEVGP